MKKKRSKGVTFWGWVFVIFGIIGILGAINPQYRIKLYGVGLFSIGIVLAIANLITGIFVLKLNETARRVVILLGVINIMLIPFWFSPLFKTSFNVGDIAKSKQNIIERVKPEYQQQEFAELDKIITRRKFMWIMLILLYVLPVLIFELLPIIFFTRPKVKEQFK